MDSYTTIWNNFCKKVSKAQNDNQKKITFEKSTMIDLLSGLGWSQLRNNLIEQKRMAVGHTEVFADFVLVDAENKKEQVVIELKRPKHNQTQEDIEQLASYMKLSYCPYGLYIGEKIEIYYNKLTDRNEPVLINSINYTLNNKEGIFLLNLLRYDSFNPNKWKDYCEDSIKLMQSVEYWTSEEGKAELFQFILDKAELSPNFTERLRTLLTISVEKNQFRTSSENDKETTNKKTNVKPFKKSKTQKKGRREVYSFNGATYNARDYAMAIVKHLMEKHPSYTYLQIKETFPKSFAWGPIMLTVKEWQAKKKSVRENYFNDILQDINGQKFVLSNQWTHDGVAKMRECLDNVQPEKAEDIIEQSVKRDNPSHYQDEHIQVEPVFRMPNKGNTVYSINGGKDFFPAGAIGYFVVKRYLEEHQNATVDEIKALMPQKLFGYNTIVDESTWKKKYVPGLQKHLRYVPFAFRDGNGNKFYVCNQWDKQRISALEELIGKIGWKVDKMVKA